MHSDNEDFTTFVTFFEAYKYRILPFELTNDPTTYQQYMNDILFEYLNDFCQAYLNNILIYSKTKKDHVKHIRLILQKLRKAGLQVNILKCEFHVQETKFLDLLVSIDGLRMNPAKIQTVVNWVTPSVRRRHCHIGQWWRHAKFRLVCHRCDASSRHFFLVNDDDISAQCPNGHLTHLAHIISTFESPLTAS